MGFPFCKKALGDREPLLLSQNSFNYQATMNNEAFKTA